MIKNFINNIKLNRLSYLLEVIEVRDFRSKINAYNKIKKMKITKEMGLLILDDSNFTHDDNYSDFNISLSLISLLFDNYYDEYSDKIYEIFPNLTDESKYEVLKMLSYTDNLSAVSLYKDLVLKYYKILTNIPIGTLFKNPDNYYLLFPYLFKIFNNKYKNTNNLIMLLSDFINLGVVLEKDIKKNKKVIQEEIKRIFKKACAYKYSKDVNFMQDSDYINLRIYLESAINIEYYVSNKETVSYLEKLYKKKDNQIKLFILDNYVRKGKDIKKYNLLPIAKDNLSRYPLYSFLNFYKLENLMPKKYAKNKLLSESDLFINYCNANNYNKIPFDFELVDEDILDDHKYYLFKFKTKYNYYEEITDPATDYILKNTSIDKELLENSEIEYYGVSGGFDIEDPSLVTNPLSSLLIYKKEDLEELTLSSILNKSKPKKAKKEKTKKERKKLLSIFSALSLSNLKSKLPKKKEKVAKEELDLKEIENKLEEVENVIEESKEQREKIKEKKKILTIFSSIKDKFPKKKEKEEEKEQEININEIENKLEEVENVIEESKEQREEIKEVTSKKSENESIFTNLVLKRKEKKKNKVLTEDEILNSSILRKIISFNSLLILIFILFSISFVVLLSILFDFDIFNLKKNSSILNTNSISPVKLNSDKFTEIKYDEIFNRDKKEYYVLFFNKKEKSTYYNYINTMLENKYDIYFVDISKEENKPIYQGNSTGFVISNDTLLKVNEKEYEFYVVGKTNILNEMKTYIDEINDKKAEEAIKKAEETAKKQAEEKANKEKEEKKKTESILKSIDEDAKSKLDSSNDTLSSNKTKTVEEIIKSVEEEADKKANSKKKSN